MKKRPQIEIDKELSILYENLYSYQDFDGKIVKYRKDEDSSQDENYDWYKTWKRLRYNKQP